MIVGVSSLSDPHTLNNKSVCSNTTGHDIAVSKEVQDVLSLQTPVQADLRMFPRMAPLLSDTSRQRHVVTCQTIALHVAMDVLVRAPLPARLALAEGLHDHSSLISNTAVDPKLLVGKRRHVVLFDFRVPAAFFRQSLFV